MIELHRLHLEAAGYPGEWVDIPLARSFGARTRIEGKLQAGLREWNAQRAVEYVKRWSFVEDVTPEAIDELDDVIMRYVLDEAEAHYQRRREEAGRSAAERKSAEGEAGSGDRPEPAADLSGDGPAGGAGA